MAQALTFPMISLRLPRFGRIARLAPETPADDEARRAFIRDVICDNPDAFCSEQDIQAMMSVYGHRF